MVSATTSLETPSTAPYAIAVGGYDSNDVRVQTVHGREAMSELYRFELGLHFFRIDDFAKLEEELLGSPARLVMRWGAGTRFVCGIVDLVRADRARTDGSALYEIRVVPRFARLKWCRSSRIFQDMSVVDIVGEILDSWGVRARWSSLAGTYPKRAYCVQYQESDYEFVTRLLAEEGIFFYFELIQFEHLDPRLEGGIEDAPIETVVFADHPRGYAPLPPDNVLPYCERADSVEEGRIHGLTLKRRSGPEWVHSRQYDVLRPRSPITWSSLDPSDMTGIAPPRESIYEHHAEYESPDRARNVTRVHLEQHRAKLEVAWTSSQCRRMAPGYVISASNQEMPHVDGEYAVTWVEHHGRAPWLAVETPIYVNVTHLCPAAAPFRPPRPTRSPRQVVETALVVGPGGEEIHTDELGRVKVQFHWDQRQLESERSSCFLRVAQAWAGSAWGFQFIPRVGMEVLVAFIGGDLDNPVVMGALYNGPSPPPFALPREKTKSGIRTQSTPNNGGYSEIAFEDAAGSERLTIRAARDLSEIVRGERSAEIAGDDRSVVEHNHIRSIKGHDWRDIAGEQRVSIAEDRVVRIAGEDIIEVRLDRDDRVGGSVTQDVKGDVTTRTAGAERHTIAGDEAVSVAGSMTTIVNDTLMTVVGGGGAESLLQHAAGRAELTGGKTVLVESNEEVILRCGKSTLRITPDAIELVAPEVRINAPGATVTVRETQIAIRAKKTTEITAEKVLARSEGARILLGKDAKIDGEKVKIACDPVEGDDEFPEDDTPPTKIALADGKGRPIPHAHYLVRLDDGSAIGGILGEDGTDEVLLEEGSAIEFPEHTARREG